MKNLRQVVTAVADGAIAATSAEKHVADMHVKLDIPEFEVKRGVFKVIFRNGLEMPEEEIDKTDMYKAVVQFCTVPRSREELTAFTGKSRYYTMSAIVQPLIDQGKLRLSNPDKPKSPKQRYIALRQS